MNYWKSLKGNFYKPSWWVGDVYPFVTGRIRSKITEAYTRRSFEPSAKRCHVMGENWDNLVILDGCRYDLFESVHTLPGTLEDRTSLGSATPEFLAENFDGATHHDTVYVTANPQLRACDVDFTDVFHDIVDVWRHEWDEEYRTVLPEQMTEATLAAHERYPDKRIISHYVQPHYPFVGEYGDQIGDHSGNEASVRDANGETPERDHPTVWKMVKRGDVSLELVEKAYRENLELVLPYVSELLDELEGKTVVTSDHGNHLGEQPVPLLPPLYSHPPNVYTTELRRVPWLEVDAESRKEVSSEHPDTAERRSNVDVTQRLADLGYV